MKKMIAILLAFSLVFTPAIAFAVDETPPSPSPQQEELANRPKPIATGVSYFEFRFVDDRNNAIAATSSTFEVTTDGPKGTDVVVGAVVQVLAKGLIRIHPHGVSETLRPNTTYTVRIAESYLKALESKGEPSVYKLGTLSITTDTQGKVVQKVQPVQPEKTTPPKTTPSKSTAPPVGAMKIHLSTITESNRYSTAVAIAREVYPNGLRTSDGYKNVIIASGHDFPDALGGMPMTAAYDAPMLLTGKDGLPGVVIDYIRETKANNAIILGGVNAVTENVTTQLRGLGMTTSRVAGETRYGTAVRAGEQLLKLLNDRSRTEFLHGFNNNARVFLASGEGYADALTVSVPARQFGTPILLTNANSLPADTIEALKTWQVKEIVIVGGEMVVSKKVEAQIDNLGLGITVNRLYGADRNETSMKVAQTYYPQTNEAFVARDDDFADALAGSLLAAVRQSPILLIKTHSVPKMVADYIRNENITEITILGGESAVSNLARNELNRIILSND